MHTYRRRGKRGVKERLGAIARGKDSWATGEWDARGGLRVAENVPPSEVVSLSNLAGTSTPLGDVGSLETDCTLSPLLTSGGGGRIRAVPRAGGDHPCPGLPVTGGLAAQSRAALRARLGQCRGR